MKVKIYLFFVFLTLNYSYSQKVDIDKVFKAIPLKVSGVISANSVFYNSNQNASRKPFSYFTQGALNFNIYGFSIPVSYSYTNQDSQLGYQLPFSLKRLSLHPTYKWATAHIGSVNMNFSPYTLNGHQFTGGGLELSPKKKPFKVKLMGGRLLKATQDDNNPRTQPAFERIGYGIDAAYEFKKFNLEIIAFYAKDKLNSLDSIPENKNVLPQENLVTSFKSKIKFSRKFTFDIEYANTLLTKDLRSNTVNSSKSILLKKRTSTATYNAFKSNLNYILGKSTLNIGYERIEPGYKTLGAYFFNNDFENVTFNTTSSLFKNKVAISLTLGQQRDDLNGEKINKTSRTIAAINTTYNVNERLTITGAFSNLNSFTNVKPNQFEDINDSDLTDEFVENLDFRQLSKTLNLNLNYILSKNKELPQNLNINYNLTDVANEQGGIVRIGDGSTFHNMSIGHSINFNNTQTILSSNINLTLNTIGRENATTWGPSISLAKLFFNKTLNTQISSSYNQSNNNNGSINTTNIRLGANYTLHKKHNFNFNIIQLFRKNKSDLLNEITSTIAYSYSFGLKKPKINFSKSDIVALKFKKRHLKGTKQEITQQILSSVKDQHDPNVRMLVKQLKNSEKKSNKEYKKNVITLLKYNHHKADFKIRYHQLLYNAFDNLYTETIAVNQHFNKELEAIYNQKISESEILKIKHKIKTHHKIISTLEKWKINLAQIESPTSKSLKRFISNNFEHTFKINQLKDKQITDQLFIQIIKYIEKL